LIREKMVAVAATKDLEIGSNKITHLGNTAAAIGTTAGAQREVLIGPRARIIVIR
jgi:hypothetical protein